MRLEIELRVNGTAHSLGIEPHQSLGHVLNEQLGLNGVRLSCEEGECGTCTVLVDGTPMNSCLMLAAQAQGSEILTIEGLGTPDRLHPLQQAFIDEHGFQCSFCTPGFIMSAKALLDSESDPAPDEVAASIAGNICRCGSYPNIVRSILRAAAVMAGEAGDD